MQFAPEIPLPNLNTSRICKTRIDIPSLGVRDLKSCSRRRCCIYGWTGSTFARVTNGHHCCPICCLAALCIAAASPLFCSSSRLRTASVQKCRRPSPRSDQGGTSGGVPHCALLPRISLLVSPVIETARSESISSSGYGGDLGSRVTIRNSYVSRAWRGETCHGIQRGRMFGVHS